MEASGCTHLSRKPVWRFQGREEEGGYSEEKYRNTREGALGEVLLLRMLAALLVLAAKGIHGLKDGR